MLISWIVRMGEREGASRKEIEEWIEKVEEQERERRRKGSKKKKEERFSSLFLWEFWFKNSTF